MGGIVGKAVAVDGGLLIELFVRAFFRAYLDGFHRSLLSDLERTSPTPKPKSHLKGENPSIAPGTANSCVVRGSEI